MTGWVVLVVGALLCFAGVLSTHLAVLVCGFGLGWLIADVIGASAGVALLVGLAGAVVAWVVVTLVLKTALFFVGALAGTVIGGRLYGVLQPTGGNVAVMLGFVVALGLLGGWLASRRSSSVLLLLTALAGAGLLLSGLGRAVDQPGWLHDSQTATQRLLLALLWLVVAALGWTTQRRLPRGRSTSRR